MLSFLISLYPKKLTINARKPKNTNKMNGGTNLNCGSHEIDGTLIGAISLAVFPIAWKSTAANTLPLVLLNIQVR